MRYRIRLTLFVASVMLGAAEASLIPGPLGLVPGSPDISSSFIDVSYVGNSNAGTLNASGFAVVLTPPGSPSGNIAGGTFDVSAFIQSNALTASGTLNIGGTIPGLGFNSGTLLTGTLSSMGAGPGDALEFAFDITGGDAVGVFGGFGATAGVIVSKSGYPGSFDSNFSSSPFAALADTFPVAVPEPSPIIIWSLLGAAVCACRRRRIS